jgi:hypothetical protein
MDTNDGQFGAFEGLMQSVFAVWKPAEALGHRDGVIARRPVMSVGDDEAQGLRADLNRQWQDFLQV